ncbi:hypothetical protein N7527_000391 [Penicillium freii]|nr:hypothetical protein N7527_000391 [Penicillium freii]
MVTTRKRKNISPDPEAFQAGPSASHRTSPLAPLQHPGQPSHLPSPKERRKKTPPDRPSPLLQQKKKELTSNDTAVCWSALYTCFPASREVIKGSTIDEPSNGFLLAASLHSIAFKPIPDDNFLYEIVVYKSRGPTLPRFCDEGQKVRMNQHPEVAEVNRTLLDLHGRLCDVFNASGAGEEIDRSLDKWDEIKDRSGCLAADGSTNIEELLWYSLSTSNMPHPYSTKVCA